VHAVALTVPRLSAGCTSTRLPGLVNLEWARRLVGAGQLRKDVCVAKELDQVLLAESNHAESAHSNRGQLGGRTSTLVADHAWACALRRVGCLLRITLFKGLFLGAHYADRARRSSIFELDEPLGEPALSRTPGSPPATRGK
jgi:hypothetical protein